MLFRILVVVSVVILLATPAGKVVSLSVFSGDFQNYK